MNQMMIWGHGYVTQFLKKPLIEEGWRVISTSRNVPIGSSIQNDHETRMHFFDPNLASYIQSSDAILSTVPPDESGTDPVLKYYQEIITTSRCRWIGYLSATSVYGDHRGAWVDEQALCKPSHLKAQYRLLIEQQWLGLYDQWNLPVHIFRLSGIYGPKNNCLEEIDKGKKTTLIKNNHFFSRIHVEDIAQSIMASVHQPTAGQVYNVSDDKPAPLHEVHQFAASLLGKEPLQMVPVEESNISEPMRLFFQDHKKVNAQKIKKTLGIRWIYPDYQSGLSKDCLFDRSI